MRLIPLAALGLALTGPLAGQDIVGRNESTFTLSESVGEGAWVRIATFNGRVDITRGSGRRVEIRAVKDIRRGETDDIGFVVRREGGGITVCAVWVDRDECDGEGNMRSESRSGNWSRDRQGQVVFTVQIPAGVRVKAASGNGDVMVAGAGDRVIAATGNGRVMVQDASGPVEASTGNGEIRVNTAMGPVSASSGNGAIDVSIGKLDRSTDMKFSTGNGAVTLRLPDGFGAELDASTGNGTVTTDFPIQMRGGRLNRTRLRGTLGDGGGVLSIISGNGDVEIRKQR
jgi:hypothetical protein